MKHPELDWDQLAAMWEDESAHTNLHARLRKKIGRQRVVMRVQQVFEVSVLVSLAVFCWRYLGVHPTRSQVAVVALALAWAAALWGYAVWNRRQSWRADSEGVGDYLHLLERRALARRRTAWVVGPLTVVQVAIVLAMLAAAADNPGQGRRSLQLTGWLVAVIVVAVGVWAVWRGRAAGRELQEIESTRKVMADDMASIHD